MGFFGDQVVLGQKPRKNGCICAHALIPIALTAGGAVYAVLKMAEKVMEQVIN